MPVIWKFDSDGNRIFVNNVDSKYKPNAFNSVAIDKEDNIFALTDPHGGSNYAYRVSASDGSIVWSSDDISTLGNQPGDGYAEGYALHVDENDRLLVFKMAEVLQLDKADGSFKQIVTTDMAWGLGQESLRGCYFIPSTCSPGHKTVTGR